MAIIRNTNTGLILSESKAHCYCKLKRNSTIQIQIEKINSEKNFVIVNEKKVDLTTSKRCDIAGTGVRNLIASDGTDSGITPIANTNYHIYLSNNLVSWASETIALSNFSPVNGEYLGTSENALNWRRVGYISTDTSGITITNDWQLCGFGIDIFEKTLTSTITRTSGSSGFYQDANLQMNKVTVLPNTVISVIALIRGHYDVPSSVIANYLYINGNAKTQSGTVTGNSANVETSGCAVGLETFISSGSISIEQRYHYGGANTLTISSGPVTALEVTRITY